MNKLNLFTVIILILSIIKNCINIVTSIIKYNVDSVLFIVDEPYYNTIISNIIINPILVLSFILILSLNKWGYYLFILSNVSYIITLCSIKGDFSQNISFSIINTIFISLLLLLKKDGIRGFFALKCKPSFETIGIVTHSMYTKILHINSNSPKCDEESVTNSNNVKSRKDHLISNILISILILILFSLFYITIK